MCQIQAGLVVLFLLVESASCRQQPKVAAAIPDYSIYHSECDFLSLKDHSCSWCVWSLTTIDTAVLIQGDVECRAQLMDNVEKLVDSVDNVLIDLPSHTEDNYTAEVPIVTISPAHPVEGEVLRVLVNFGEHAREFISAETGLHFLKLLAQKELLTAQFDAFSSKAGNVSDTATLLALLDCCVVLKVWLSSSNSSNLSSTH